MNNSLALPFKKFLTHHQTEYLVVDQDLIVVDLSPQAAQLADQPALVQPGQDIRLGFPELIGSESCLQAVLSDRQAFFELKGVGRSQRPLPALNGTVAEHASSAEIYLNLYITKSENDPLSVPRLFIFVEDATERTNLDQSLLQAANETSLLLHQLTASKNYIDCIIDSIADALLVTTKAGIIKTLNPAAKALLGYSDQELIGASISKILTFEPARSTVQSSMTQHPIHSMETVCVTQQGVAIPVELSYAAVQAELEDGWVYIIRDVSDRKRIEQALMAQNAALEQSKQEADQANQAKSEFLAMMSHEIRTPMNAVIGMTQLMLDLELDPQQRDYAEMIQTGSDMLLSIIDDILDFSKIESGKLELEYTPFSLRNCVQDALNLLSTKAAEKELELAFLDKPTLPRVILGDATRLRQILVNLLSNAIKFTEAGEVIVSLQARSINSQAPVYEFQFSVRDTGMGIPADRLDRLFQKFSQVDSSITRQYGGTGLGLAISKKLCELMGGSIWVESQPGQGSTFYFTIAAEALPEDALTHPSIRPGALSQRPLRILVAEDQIMNQKVAVLMLKKLGYEAEVVKNGLEVLAALQQANQVRRYDVILMDLQMPEMDGITTTELIMQDWEPALRPRIIAMTANVIERDRQLFLRAGIESYITKPVRLEELAAALNRHGSGRTGQQETPEGFSPPASGASELSVDLGILRAIQTLALPSDPGFVAETIALYLETSEELLVAMQIALRQTDVRTLKRLSHTLCSGSATIGAMHLAKLCTNLETVVSQCLVEDLVEALSEDYWMTVNECASRIRLEYSQVREILRTEYQRLCAS